MHSLALGEPQPELGDLPPICIDADPNGLAYDRHASHTPALLAAPLPAIDCRRRSATARTRPEVRLCGLWAGDLVGGSRCSTCSAISGTPRLWRVRRRPPARPEARSAPTHDRRGGSDWAVA